MYIDVYDGITDLEVCGFLKNKIKNYKNDTLLFAQIKIFIHYKIRAILYKKQFSSRGNL